MKKNFTLALVVGAFVSSSAHAGFPTGGNISGFTDANVSTLMSFGALASAHRAHMPATPLGLAGFDIGVGATAFSMPSNLSSLLSTLNGGTAQIPSLIPVPKVYFHKGLPLDIDLEFSGTYFPMGDNQSVYSIGGDVKWAFVSGVAVPSIAVRGGYTKANAWFIDTSTFNFDVSISKSFVIIDPYVGGGFRYWTGTLNVPVGGGNGLSVSANSSGTTPMVYGGLLLKLGFLRLAGEFEYNTVGFTTFGGKLSFGI